MGTVKCSKCGEKCESNIFSSLCLDCRRKRGTKSYLIIAIVILVIGFIGGIILGSTNKVVELTYESSISSKYDTYEEVFNTSLMVYVWTATAVGDIIIFAIYSICRRLDLLIDKKDAK